MKKYRIEESYFNAVDSLANIFEPEMEDTFKSSDEDQKQDKTFYTNIVTLNIHINIDRHDFEKDETYEYVNKYAAIYKVLLNELNKLLAHPNLVDINFKRFNVTAHYEIRDEKTRYDLLDLMCYIPSLSEMFNKILMDYHLPPLTLHIGASEGSNIIVPIKKHDDKFFKYMILGETNNQAIDGSILAFKQNDYMAFDETYFNNIKDYMKNSYDLDPLQICKKHRSFYLTTIHDYRIEQFVQEKLFNTNKKINQALNNEPSNEEDDTFSSSLNDDDDVSTF